MSVVCEVCEKSFSAQSKLNRHLEEVRKKELTSNKFRNNRCLEEGCSEVFPSNRFLVEHLESTHGMKFETKNYSMNNWSGYVPKDPTSRLRWKKSQGSCKMDSACTSQIRVSNEHTKIIVQWQSIHYGHTESLEHIRLSKFDKHAIASKLVAGVSCKKILATTRDAIEGSLKRINLLNPKDIRNIRTSYGIDVEDGNRDSNDALSVDLWVKERRSKANPEILMYKKQGEHHEILKLEEFCLIIMNNFQKYMLRKFPGVITVDGTHGLNGYDCEMTTVMVIDEFHHGFPVAVMFSNRKDTLVQSIFFACIREAIGHVNCQILMTDMAEAYFNAWRGITGDGSQHLYCAWHVDRAWQSHLNKIKNKETRDKVYSALKTLQQQTDEVNFRHALNSALSFMCGNVETKLFGEYFKTNYSTNYSKRAYCFRRDSSINTNMHLESWHKKIKYYYLDRKTVKRLDKGLHCVMNAIRDMSANRLSRLIKGEITKKTREVTRQHLNALKHLEYYDLFSHKAYWEMKKKDGTSYTIRPIKMNKCCEQKCLYCNSCIHMYSCDCKYFVKTCKMMCHHIHIMLCKNGATNSEEVTAAVIEEEPAFNEVSAVEEQQLLINKPEKSITQLLHSLSDMRYEELDSNIKSAIHKHLTIANNLAKANTVDNVQFKMKGTTLKRNIAPQIRFQSTKRKKSKEVTTKKRSLQEVSDAKNDLSHSTNDSFLYISLSQSNDHNYLT